MASLVTFPGLSYFVKNSRIKTRFQVRVQSLGGGDLTVLSSDTFVVNGTSVIEGKEKNGSLIDSWLGKKGKNGALINGGDKRLKSRVEKNWVDDASPKDMDVLWDDGYGSKTVMDYLNGTKDIIKPDGGPPRWFCPVECGQPSKDSPILLFLPGLDGVGLGLTLHHKALGKAFEVQCLHIPVYDQTPFEELVKSVEETVRLEHALSPNKPIYLVGESFGACLALAVAAHNPEIDLVVILVNPATSFSRSQLQHFLPLLEALPDGLYDAVPYLLSFILGNPVKMAKVNIEHRLPPRLKIQKIFRNLTAFLPCLSVLADIFPKDTFLWKLKLLKSAAAYANSCLHAVKAEVLLLASGKDYMLPSRDEAQRLKSLLQNCIVRYFKDGGHAMLMEDGVNLLTIIKGTSKYRHSRKLNFVSDYLPISMSESRCFFEEMFGLLRIAAGSAVFSTLDNGKIVRGLAGVPNEGPVLLVGYHMLMATEIYSLAEEFLRQKYTMIRGLAHPDVFTGKLEGSCPEFGFTDWMKVVGAVPVTASNLFKLLSMKSHVLLYPGGSRESLHYKGEDYKLFWPDQPEFVRMAAKFGATIVPFGTVGEDDILNLVLDYNDLMKIPILNDCLKELNRNATIVRDKSKGEVANQHIFMPGVLPKLPGRFYFLFGKPIYTKGKEDILQDKQNANELYLQIKSQVEHNIAYLLKKRKEDPYRNLIDRTIYRALYSPLNDIPAFDP